MILVTVSEVTPVFTTSQRGKPVMLLGRYRYNMKPKTVDNPRTRWVCVKIGEGCRATITTYYEEIISIQHAHTH